MTPDKQTIYVMRRGVLVALIALILMAAFASFYMGRVTGPTLTRTIAETTISSITSSTFTETVVSTLNFTEYLTTTTTNTSFVTLLPPPSLTIQGNASTRTPLTVAVAIDFISASGGEITSAKVNDGKYALSLPNNQAYNVKIHYTVTPTGDGACIAGGIVLRTYDELVLANWSC